MRRHILAANGETPRRKKTLLVNVRRPRRAPKKGGTRFVQRISKAREFQQRIRRSNEIEVTE